MLSLYKLFIRLIGRIKRIHSNLCCRILLEDLMSSSSYRFEVGNNFRMAPDLIINIDPACQLLIGNDVTIWERSIIQARNGGILTIGNGTRLGRDCNITSHKKITIGNNVLFSSYIWVTDHQHKFNLKEPVSFDFYDNFRPIKIQDGVMIGNKVTIMQGVTIGKNCVVGSNSVVTKDIPDGCVAAGVPARVIKTTKDLEGCK